MEAIFEFLAEIFGECLIRIITLPIVLLLATPVILIVACFAQQPYWMEVRDDYINATLGWLGG